MVGEDEIDTRREDNADSLDNRVNLGPGGAPTTYAPVIRWNNDTAALYKGFRCRQNAELSALLVIDGDRGLAISGDRGQAP